MQGLPSLAGGDCDTSKCFAPSYLWDIPPALLHAAYRETEGHVKPTQ